jgi:CRP/FNR family cyclic AMP-dependent transcriptional regulator
MASQHPFDPQTFLAKVGTGRTLVACPKESPIFAQGDVADAVFYIQDGQVKLSVVSARGKEAVIPSLPPRPSLGRAVWPGSRCVWQRPRRSPTAR